ncbi:hypothetical protein [Williamsia sp. D3]|uniref:hypothetical protein n=1 Tax=Williamsia sp. D3 TaxID=1313067 RepID=UPI0003D3215A|nr:hypothetical protein [Williamsia sp. D3]ETD30787.1 hypothetical protein W823_22685 [Williamsia sp. D3]PZU02684.1 MAG: hypothetical protein DI630_07370 [Gordonia sp. (in: high G+C Gram-positive bacteria)]
MSHRAPKRPIAATIAVAASMCAALLVGGCAATSSEPAPPTSSTQIINGDPAVVELAQDLTAVFGPLEFSSVRPHDPYPEHAEGLALDVMVPGWDTPAGRELGDRIAVWVSDHAPDYRVSYTLWRQHYQPFPTNVYKAALMEDRGSPTANHLDHLHITVNPAGAQDV